MQTLTLTIGHNVGTCSVWSFEQVAATAADILALDGMTAFPVLGIWQGSREESTRIEVYAEPEEVERILSATPALARALRQECIAATVDGVPRFIAATGSQSAA